MVDAAPDASDYARDTARLRRLGARLVVLRQRHHRLTALFRSTHASFDDAVDASRVLARLEQIDSLLSRVEARLAVVAAATTAFAEKRGDGS